MGEVIGGLAVFAVVIGVGWLLVRTGAVPRNADAVLTRVCFFAATPALLVCTLADADLGRWPASARSSRSRPSRPRS